jgi:mono/diheme cytochrome c family protein
MIIKPVTILNKIYLILLLLNTFYSCGEKPKKFENKNSKVLTSTNGIGEKLFDSNCQQCHGVIDTIIGSPLRGLVEKRGMEWIYEFVNNSEKMIKNKDSVSVQIYKHYGMTLMPPFPNLTRTEIDSIFKYVEELDIKK